MDPTGTTFEMDDCPFKTVETPYGAVMISANSVDAMRFLEIAGKLCERMPGELLQTMVDLGSDVAGMIDELQNMGEQK